MAAATRGSPSRCATTRRPGSALPARGALHAAVETLARMPQPVIGASGAVPDLILAGNASNSRSRARDYFARLPADRRDADGEELLASPSSRAQGAEILMLGDRFGPAGAIVGLVNRFRVAELDGAVAVRRRRAARQARRTQPKT